MSFKIVTFQDYFFIDSAIALAALGVEEVSKSQKAHNRRVEACVIGTVTCAASFLECTVNGLYEHAQEGSRRTKFHFALANVWNDSFERLPILAKYQLALTLCGRKTFPIGGEPYQSAETLIELRNAIAHPKEIIGSDRNQQKLERRLRGRYKFGSPRDHCDEFFPDRCLSADCAIWAADAALKFTLDFKRRLPPTAYLFGPQSDVAMKMLHDLRQFRKRLHST